MTKTEIVEKIFIDIEVHGIKSVMRNEQMYLDMCVDKDTPVKNNGALGDVSGSLLLNDLIKEGEEIIAINGLRFTGTHEEKIKQVFDKHGIKYQSPF